MDEAKRTLFGMFELAAETLRVDANPVHQWREAVDAKWDEFDLDAAIWCIPAGRIKMRREQSSLCPRRPWKCCGRCMA
ncbi:MAG: hypothetical protein IOMNBAOH_02047 [Rhodocyclaceae bacterium]|nr:hypothetical protein [Rhodocyclaceae bacterium]